MSQQTIPNGAVLPTFAPTNAPWLWVQSVGDFDLFKGDTADRVVTPVAWTKRRLTSTSLTTTGKAAVITELATYFTSGHLTTVQTTFVGLPFSLDPDCQQGWMVVDTASASTVNTALASALGNVA